MKKKILLTVALSHSSMFHMQAPISSDEAAHTLLHLLSITARDIAIIRDEVVAEVVNKEEKKSLVLDKFSHFFKNELQLFLHSGILFSRITQQLPWPLDWLPFLAQ